MIDGSNLLDVVLGGTISGGAVGALVLAMAKWALSRVTQRLDVLAAELERLKEERVAAVEARQEKFENACATRHDRLSEGSVMMHRIKSDLDNLMGWTKKMDAKLDRIAEETSAQRSDIAGQSKWIQNLDNAHQAHVRDREVHRG